MKIPLNAIQVGPRQRVDLGNIDDLAESLKEHGQLHSIGVRPGGKDNVTYLLIYGRRRLEAARRLGWTEIEATVREGLSPLQEQLIEFEEDFARKDRNWQELCIAVYKVNAFYEKAQKRGEIQQWSSRALARVTGESNMSMNYKLRVASGLVAEPRDEELWSCEGWWPAVQLLVKRQEAEITKEMDRRKPPVVIPEGAAPATEDGSSAEGQVQSLYPTPEKVIIKVHGFPWSFADKRTLDWAAETWSCVLAFGGEVPWGHLVAGLRPGGYALLWDWNYVLNNEGTDFEMQPNCILWHKISTSPGLWPFASNCVEGVVLRRGAPHQQYENPSPAVISATVDADDPSVLPPAVVEFSVRPLAADNMAVIIPCGVNPVHIAEMGRVPLWFEPDPVRFQAKFEALKRHYEANIPNCEVVLREV